MTRGTTMDAEVERFLAEKQRRTQYDRHDDDFLSPASYDQYEFIMHTVVLPFCQEESVEELGQVTDDVLKRFDAWLRGRKKRDGKPLGAQSRRTYWRCARVFLNWAQIEAKWQPARPKNRMSRDELLADQNEVLSRKQIDALEDRAVGERDKLIVRVLGDTGIRVGELLSLRVKDLVEQKHDRKFFLMVDGKTGPRKVSIPADVFKRLHTFAIQCGRARDGRVDEEAPIFMAKRRNAAGKVLPLTRSGVLQLLKHLGSEADIPFRVHPHLFRSSYTTHQLDKDVQAVKVMHQLGHTTMTMILKHYDRLKPEQGYDDLINALRPDPGPRRR